MEAESPDGAIRVVVIDLPRMVREFFEEGIANRRDMRIVAEPKEPGALSHEIAVHDADVLITGSPFFGHKPLGALLETHPRLKVLAVEPDGSDCFLHELGRAGVSLGGAAPSRLLEALSRAVRPEPAAAGPNGGPA